MIPFSIRIERTIVFLTHAACPKATANFIVQRIIEMAKMSRTQKTSLAERTDVLLDARRVPTCVPVLDFVVGGVEFVTMAGPCSVETESQLMATARHVRRAERVFCVAALSSYVVLLMRFKAWASKA
jgi:3-deoxy-7-phosphoheptulonate synthase